MAICLGWWRLMKQNFVCYKDKAGRGEGPLCSFYKDIDHGGKEISTEAAGTASVSAVSIGAIGSRTIASSSRCGSRNTQREDGSRRVVRTTLHTIGIEVKGLHEEVKVVGVWGGADLRLGSGVANPQHGLALLHERQKHVTLVPLGALFVQRPIKVANKVLNLFTSELNLSM